MSVLSSLRNDTNTCFCPASCLSSVNSCPFAATRKFLPWKTSMSLCVTRTGSPTTNAAIGARTSPRSRRGGGQCREHCDRRSAETGVAGALIASGVKVRRVCRHGAPWFSRARPACDPSAISRSARLPRCAPIEPSICRENVVLLEARVLRGRVLAVLADALCAQRHAVLCDAELGAILVARVPPEPCRRAPSPRMGQVPTRLEMSAFSRQPAGSVMLSVAGAFPRFTIAASVAGLR